MMKEIILRTASERWSVLRRLAVHLQRLLPGVQPQIQTDWSPAGQICFINIQEIGLVRNVHDIENTVIMARAARPFG